VEEFLEDIQLIWNNCKLYNVQCSVHFALYSLQSKEIYNNAVELQSYFIKLTQGYYPEIQMPNTDISF